MSDDRRVVELLEAQGAREAAAAHGRARVWQIVMVLGLTALWILAAYGAYQWATGMRP